MPDKFWTIKAAKDNVGELYLYGYISSTSWWDDEITPKQFKQDLDALGDVSEIKVFINSGGGDVFAGQAIHSMLKRHKAKISVYVDGLAASIASVIAMAGDTVYMPRNAMMMVHKAWTVGIGNADELRKLADDLDKIGESIIAAYQDKTGLEKDRIDALLGAETWMTAEDAVEMGFADEIEEEKQVAASLNGKNLVVNGQEMDISNFRNIPSMFLAHRTEPRKEDDYLSKELETKVTELESLLAEKNSALATAEATISELNAEIGTLHGEIDSLGAKIAELEPLAKDGEKFKNFMVDETHKWGVKALGNNYKQEMYDKVFATLTVDGVMEFKESFEAQARENIPTGRVTQGATPTNDNKLKDIPDPIKDEKAFREMVVARAEELRKEDPKLSVKESIKSADAELRKEVC